MVAEGTRKFSGQSSPDNTHSLTPTEKPSARAGSMSARDFPQHNEQGIQPVNIETMILSAFLPSTQNTDFEVGEKID